MLHSPVRHLVELVPVTVDGVHINLAETGHVHDTCAVKTRGTSLRVLGPGQLVLDVAVGDQD